MALDLTDIQGNLLRGYRSANACHFALGIGDAKAAESFITRLLSDDEQRSPQITYAEEWDDKPHYTLNLGVTFAGLQALGVAPEALGAFPVAFQQGPADQHHRVHPRWPGDRPVREHADRRSDTGCVGAADHGARRQGSRRAGR